MKKLTLLLICLSSLQAFSQMAVTDPGSYAYQAQVLKSNVEIVTKAKESIEQAKKHTQFLQDARDAINKVNNKLRDLELIRQTIYHQTVAIKNAENAIDFCKRSDTFSFDEINMIIYNFTRLVDVTNTTVSLMNKLVSDGYFKMNDSERIEALSELSRQSRATRNDVDRLYETYTRIAQQRQMFKAFER